MALPAPPALMSSSGECVGDRIQKYLDLGYRSLSTFRIALANIRFPATPEESVTLAEKPSLRRPSSAPGSSAFRSASFRATGDGEAGAAARSCISRTRLVRRCSGRREGKHGGCSWHRTRRRCSLVIAALVINRDGTIAGFQDKVQLDPSEESTYSPGSGRQIFQDRPADIWDRDLP